MDRATVLHKTFKQNFLTSGNADNFSLFLSGCPWGVITNFRVASGPQETLYHFPLIRQLLSYKHLEAVLLYMDILLVGPPRGRGEGQFVSGPQDPGTSSSYVKIFNYSLFRCIQGTKGKVLRMLPDSIPPDSLCLLPPLRRSPTEGVSFWSFAPGPRKPLSGPAYWKLCKRD